MNKLEPTYLRYVYDELGRGSLSSDNASSLPHGFIGLFEKEFTSDIPLSRRSSTLKRLCLWALLKKAVSSEFVSEVLKENTDSTKALIDTYSKWFNSPEPGKYVLFHDRLRSYLIQKLSDHEAQEINEQLIAYLEQSLESSIGEESELYALEHLSTHMAVESQLDNNYERLHDFVNREDLWPRQIKVSNEYKWSQAGIQYGIMEGARRHDEVRSLVSTINSLKIHQLEQSDYESIIEFIFSGEYILAINRLEKIDIHLRYKLSMLLIHDLTIGGLKDEIFVKDACSFLINSVKDLISNFNGNIEILNWSSYFEQDELDEIGIEKSITLPTILMFIYHCKLKEIGIDDSCLWQFNINFNNLICDDQERNKMSSQYSEKLLSYKKENKDEDQKTSLIDNYFMESFVESAKYIQINKVDLIDLAHLVDLSPPSYKKKDDLLKILSYHFNKNTLSERNLIRNENYGDNIYYSLPGDKEIISLVINQNIHPSSEDTINNYFKSCLQLNKILFEESKKRNIKYNLKWEFIERLKLSKDLIKTYKLKDNIFNQLRHFIKIIDSEFLITADLKSSILEKSEAITRESNFHKAHEATALSYLSEIYFLLEGNKINKSLDYFNKAFENKVSLILNYTAESDSENEIGNISELFNSGLKILFKLISEEDDKLIEPLLANLLTLLKHEININHENSIENYILIKNKEDIFRDDDNFFSFFNHYLNHIKGLIEDDIQEINLDKYFQYFENIVNEFKIDHTLSISNSSTVNLVEKYLKRFGFEGYNVKGIREIWDFLGDGKHQHDLLSSNDSFFSKPFFWNYYLINQKNIIKYFKNGNKIKSTFFLDKFIKENTYSKFINQDLAVFFRNKEITFISELLTLNFDKNIHKTNQVLDNYDLEFVVEILSHKIKEHITISQIDLFLEYILIKYDSVKFDSIPKLNEFLFNIITVRSHIGNKNNYTKKYNDLIKYLIDLIENSFDSDSEYLKRNLENLKKAYFQPHLMSIHDDLLDNITYKKLSDLQDSSLLEYYINKIGPKITKVSRFIDLNFQIYDEKTSACNGVNLINDFGDRICSSLYLYKLMLKWNDKNQAEYFLKCFNFYLNIFLNEIENFLMSGFVLYNPVDRKYENKQLSNYICEWDESYSMIVLFKNLFFDFVEIERRGFILSLIPNIDQYNKEESFFDLGYLLLLSGKTNKAIKLIEDKICDSSVRLKSMIYFYYCKYLLGVNDYKNATDISRKIHNDYFKALFYFESYKANETHSHKAKSYLSKCLDLCKNIKVQFEKSSLYLKIYKELLPLKKNKLAEEIKDKIDVEAYKLCSEVLDFSNLINKKNENESLIFINNIKKQEKNLIHKYDSDLKIEINNLEKKIHNTSTPNKILVNSESDKQTILYGDSKMDEKYYLTFFQNCTFIHMYSDLETDGACEWRDQIKLESKSNQTNNLKALLKSVRRFRFLGYEFEYHWLIQAELYIAIGKNERAYKCLLNYYPKLDKI